MTLPLYFAPIHRLSNWIYRHFLLLHGADFVFSELIMVDRWESEFDKGKFKCFSRDLYKTIFQIGANNSDEISFAVGELKKIHPNIREINLNMGCPQSSMQKRQVCGGILFNTNLMSSLSESLVVECEKNNIIPSVKLRLGTSREKILIKDYLSILQKSGVKKVYIHARPLRYNYSQPAIWSELSSIVNFFPDLELIFNGDVDSYESYLELEKFSPSGIMIGRSALINPLIFQQIKTKKNSLLGKVGKFNPELKDDELIRGGDGLVRMSNRKKLLIEEFISFAKKEHLREEILSTHIAYLNKGVSKNKFLL